MKPAAGGVFGHLICFADFLKKKKGNPVRTRNYIYRDVFVDYGKAVKRLMTIREQLELTEREYLSPFAMLSENSKGRDREEAQCDLRPVFQRDRDRILHCKSFRRMKHKTQVFLEPKGDHYRTRLTHTLEVSQTARTIAKALRLNEDLVEAIALGHDLGHTPFGHAGEKVLNDLCEGGFRHNEQSVRIVEKLENDGRGLNLTWEVRDGIRNHQLAGMPSTLEGQIVRLSDKIAYINHDMDDAIRAKLLREEDLPGPIRDTLGGSTRERLNTLIHDVIISSQGLQEIRMSAEKQEAMGDLRQYMFRHLYSNPIAKSEEEKTKGLLGGLFEVYMEHWECLPAYMQQMYHSGEPLDRVVCDYIAGMTDQYAITMFEEHFVPKAWSH